MKERPAIGRPLPPNGRDHEVTRQQGPQRLFGENPNPALTSGFTFVGQFVDHDITFDTTPLDQQQSDPVATTNFRTPRYDLDAIYGLGPNADPQFYDPADRDKFQIVETTHAISRTDTLKTPLIALRDVPRVWRRPRWSP